MYLLVDGDNIIVGSVNNRPNEEDCSKNGYRVFEIKDEEYSVDMIGSPLVDYEVVK